MGVGVGGGEGEWGKSRRLGGVGGDAEADLLPVSVFETNMNSQQ